MRVAITFTPESDIWLSIQSNILKDKTSGHYASIFSLFCKGLSIETVEMCIRMILFGTLRDILSAVVRLRHIGPMEGARLLHVLSSTVDTSFLDLTLYTLLNNLHQPCPLMDLFQ